MKKAVIFLADGCEMVEALTPVDLLRRAGADVVTMSVGEKEYITSSHQVEIRADKKFDAAEAKAADVVILPGGMPGTKHLRAHEGVCNVVKERFAEGKYIAAICAAPSVFGQLGLLKGKKAVCYPSFEEQLEGAQVLTDEVVTDKNVITSRGMGTAIPFGLAVVEALFDKKKADEIAKSVIFSNQKIPE